MRFDPPHSGERAADWPTRPHLAFWQLPHGVRVLTRLPTVDNGEAIPAEQIPASSRPLPESFSSAGEPRPTEAERRLFVGLGLPELPQLLTRISPVPDTTAIVSQVDTGCLTEVILETEQTSPVPEGRSLADPPAREITSHLPLADDLNHETPRVITLEESTSHPVIRPLLDFEPTILEIVERQARGLRWEKSRMVQWHLAQPEQLVAVRFLWSVAQAWASRQERRLLLIDGTTAGSLAEYFGWTAGPGWTDVVTGQARLSQTLCQTPWPTIDFLGVGTIAAAPQPDTAASLAAMLQAVQRDYPATWVVTSGPWSPVAQNISQLAHERQLVLHPGALGAGGSWQGLRRDLIENNVLIDGWIALESPSTTSNGMPVKIPGSMVSA
ncbi:MAG: hypothetical protein SFX18_19365 [Pirellulales bacterium]|nr:hypothetical protein [Pirellulales bacterium]